MNETLKLQVAGVDRSADLGREITAAAAARPDCGLAEAVGHEMDVLSLRSAGNTADYLDKHSLVLHARNQVDPAAFALPAGRSFRDRVRLFLWKLLRYQHDWMLSRQNSINVQLTYELEFEREERKKQVAGLERRIRELEKRATP